MILPSSTLNEYADFHQGLFDVELEMINGTVAVEAVLWQRQPKENQKSSRLITTLPGLNR